MYLPSGHSSHFLIPILLVSVYVARGVRAALCCGWQWGYMGIVGKPNDELFKNLFPGHRLFLALLFVSSSIIGRTRNGIHMLRHAWMVGEMVEPKKLVCFTFIGNGTEKNLSRSSVKMGEMPETRDGYLTVLLWITIDKPALGKRLNKIIVILKSCDPVKTSYIIQIPKIYWA